MLRKDAGLVNRRITSITIQFVILYVFWLVLSGHFQLKYMLIGAVLVGVVTYLTNDLFYAALQQGASLYAAVSNIFRQIWRFLLYIPWLLSRIVMANVQVAMIVLNPKMPVAPALLVFKTTMLKGMARVTLANSITLTPGTITADLAKDTYVIHTIQPPLAGELVEPVMQNKVAHVYLEEEQKKPDARWVYSLEDL